MYYLVSILPTRNDTMIDAEEFSIITRDGTKLVGQEYLLDQPKGLICLVHGLGEHIGRYTHVADFFTSNGFSFFGIDLRGHGHSEGRRGHTPSHDRLIDDVEEFLMYARSEYNDLPMFLYGHSMGGNIVSNYLLKKNTNELAGAVLSSPWLMLYEEPPKWKLAFASIISKFWGAFTEPNQVDPDLLTNDPLLNKKYIEDPMVFNRISARLFMGCYTQGKWAIEHMEKLKLPVLAFHGNDDKLISPLGTKTFAEKRPDLITFHALNDTKHEPHNDFKKNEVMNVVLDWVKSSPM